MPVTAVAFAVSKLTFSIDAAHISYEGRVDKETKG
jgi:hypothetical protein